MDVSLQRDCSSDKRSLRVLVIAPNDLQVYDGTTMRLIGSITSVCSDVEISLASKNLNEELKKCELKWIKMKNINPLTRLIVITFYSINRSLGKSIALDLFGRQEIDCDLIHAHWIHSIPLAKGLSEETPLLLDLHGLFELTPVDLRAPHFWAFVRISRVLERIILSNSNNFTNLIVPSLPLKNYIAERFGIQKDKIFVIPDGLDLEKIPPYEERSISSLREELGLNGGYLIVYAGTPSFYHGFWDLLKAFKLVRRYLENVHLLIITPRHMRKKFDSEGIIFIENVPKERIYKYLYASDALVLPHRCGTQFEYLPSNKLLDYIAVGKPIITYATYSATQALEHYPLKKIVECNNPSALAQGIIEALRDLRGARIDGSKIIKEYDWRVIGKRLLEVYKNVRTTS
jgi:glycosyltransferase involved in cell wall biosynthesis